MTNRSFQLILFVAILLGMPLSSNGQASERTVPVASDTGTVGLVIRIIDGSFLVKESFPEFGAGKAGAVVNDVITHINGQSTAGKSFEEVIAKLRGDIGTHVELTLKRDRQIEPVKILAERVPLGRVISAMDERRRSK